MESRRKVAIAAIILLGLSSGAYALNEATREEQFMNYYNFYDNGMPDKVVTANDFVIIKVRDKQGFERSFFTAVKLEDKQSPEALLTVPKKGPGMVEQAANNIAMLVKGRQ